MCHLGSPSYYIKNTSVPPRLRVTDSSDLPRTKIYPGCWALSGGPYIYLTIQVNGGGWSPYTIFMTQDRMKTMCFQMPPPHLILHPLHPRWHQNNLTLPFLKVKTPLPLQDGINGHLKTNLRHYKQEFCVFPRLKPLQKSHQFKLQIELQSPKHTREHNLITDAQ